MVYITGDIHGDINRIRNFCIEHDTTTDDILIILGDVGFNFFLNGRDDKLKYKASKLPITLFCVRGNHEERAENVDGYTSELFLDGIVYKQQQYPNIKFAKDGEVYNIDGKRCLVIGGAYSVDKYYRIIHSLPWFDTEQLAEYEMEEIRHNLQKVGNNFDYILTHTCPYNVRPTHLFLPQIDQSTVDNSMEYFLQDIANTITFNKWYFGHYHDNWKKDNYVMLYRTILKLGESL